MNVVNFWKLNTLQLCLEIKEEVWAINTSLMRLVWKPTERRGGKTLFWATVKLFSCFDSEFADDRVAAAGKNERKHTVSVASKTVNRVCLIRGRQHGAT